ncbi:MULTISPECIES: cysteine peptidase family C39 domain-containing protein [Pseudomonas]|jgi:ABC-type bacteriocin/lantibiotic exporter with double-glycine peptidase domain|uniref:Peptidase C39 domain-containing protein n=3 Tax=Pseudomonas TaxID=286 RepID=A0A646P4T4_9PSED|nr:hypothetical protein [Pseudomonas carnis]MBJ2236135.1 hypothetical protein [Pseudomonas fluorescens]MBJ2287480.1 hypothetical protein [Pseudomonas sp. MF6755]MBW9242772.1 hypothetical protein [Pseudomonas paracarnis]MRJ22020.1 hypothetical protein [Pseudomonas haemolytica]
MPKTPMIRQTTSNGCAWACIQMILCSHSFEPTLHLPIIPKKITDGIKKVSIRDLSSTFRLYGLRVRSWWLHEHELKNLTLPSIILFGKNHYAILVETNEQFSLIKDPRRGYLRISKTALDRLFGNIAIEILSNKTRQQSNRHS